jgi:ubiquinone biosynthesis protein
VEAELGAPLAQRFGSFEPTPLGAASIAQVHRATLPDGQPVAVKVQYPWLRDSLPADLRTLRLLLRLLPSPGEPHGALEREQLFAEFAAGLAEELDFRREADMADAIRRNLADEPDIVVPEIFRSHSAARVLTMAFHPAVSISDRPALDRLGADPAELLEILARAYARQVFVDGLFHADPHPGNLYVVDEERRGGGPRVLFLDFGLSKRLSPELRGELRAGVYALLQGDLEAFLAGMERLSMIRPGCEAGVRAAVETMFARIRGEAGGPLALPGDRVLALKDEAVVLLRETPGLRLPNDLLLYAKTVSYLFSLGAELAPEVDLTRLVVPYVLRFLAQKDDTAESD